MNPELSPSVKPLQEEYSRRGDVHGWWDPFYAQANGDLRAIPWSEKGVNPNLLEWLLKNPINGASLTACIVGCGLGDDAEHIASLGFATTAFDISPTAVDWARRRYPDSPVRYLVADLFAHNLPRFDFVLESHTLQALPRELRANACRAIAALTGDRLLVIARGCDQPEPNEEIPWPLTPAELAVFETEGLRSVKFEDYVDAKPRRRFRVEYRR